MPRKLKLSFFILTITCGKWVFKKFNELEEFLKEVGYENIKSKLYKDKRHELLNEIDKEIIYKDVLDFYTN